MYGHIEGVGGGGGGGAGGAEGFSTHFIGFRNFQVCSLHAGMMH